MPRFIRVLSASLCGLGLLQGHAAAQAPREAPEGHLATPRSGHFRASFAEADALFDAFRQAEALVAERLLEEPGAPASRIETDAFHQISQLLSGSARPAGTPAAPGFAALAPRAREVLGRAAHLQRLVYDVYADERVVDRRAAVDALVDAYLARPQTALSPLPKSMTILDERRGSRPLGERYPRVNGLVWAFTWLEMGTLEPLVVFRTPDERQAGVRATVERFREMLAEPPTGFPSHMPMAPTVAPGFVDLHPRAAAIFDNFHMLRGVVFDLLADERVIDKRAAVDRAVDQFTDPRHLAISELDWIAMALRHGIYAQGGPAIGRLERPERNRDDHAAHGRGGGRMMAPSDSSDRP